MEKFSDYRDKGTGISPFMPEPRHESVITTYIARPVLFLIKLPFLLAFTLLLALVSPIGPICRPLLSLYLLIFFNISEKELLVDGIKKSNTSGIAAKRPTAGDVVLFNFSSPLDSLVLYLISTSNAVFYRVDSNGKLVKVGSPANCFQFALSQPTLESSPTETVPLRLPTNQVSFIIVEGTTTNNKSVLQFPKDFDVQALASANTVHIKTVSLKLKPTAFLTTPLPESAFKFIYDNVSNYRLDGQYRMKLFETSPVTTQAVRTDLSNYGKLKLLGADLDLAKKIQFIDQYKSIMKSQ